LTWTTVGRFLGTFGGLWLLTTLTSSLLNVLIGAVSVLAAIATLIAPSFTPDRRALVAAGVQYYRPFRLESLAGAVFRAMTGRTVNPQVPGSSPRRGANSILDYNDSIC
jgi:uncharacterized membrane protein YfcA